MCFKFWAIIHFSCSCADDGFPRCECGDLPQENVTSNTKNPPIPRRPLVPPLRAIATWSSNNATRAQENTATDLPLGTRQKQNATNTSRSNDGLTECFYNQPYTQQRACSMLCHQGAHGFAPNTSDTGGEVP